MCFNNKVVTKYAPLYRRLRRVLAAGVAIGVALTPLPGLGHADLTVVNWGGAAARAQMLSVVRPFEALHEVRLDMLHYDGDLEAIRTQVDTANVTWDVVHFQYSDLISLCNEGYLEDIDHATLPRGADGSAATADFIRGALPPCAVGNAVRATVLGYSERAFADNPPRSIADFFDVRRYPGKRGLRRDPRAALEWALLADGVAPAEVYTVLSTHQGVKRAFAQLDRIKSSVVWWRESTEPAQLLKQGEVVMTSAWNGHLYRPITEHNQPIDILWDGQVWEIELLGIVEGTRHPQLAREFIGFATGSERSVAETRYISHGPVRKSAAALVGDDVRAHLPTTGDNMTRAVRADSQWWARHIEKLGARFEHWIESDLDSGQIVAERSRF